MKTAVIGSFVVDLMARAPHLPREGETVKGSLFRMGGGGKGYNQAVAAAKAGADLFFSTKVGKDSFSQILYSQMEDNGIRDHLVFESISQSTATALISVDENTSQNEIIVVLGASETIGEEEIEKMFSRMEGVKYLLLQYEINDDALGEIIRKAYARGIKVILNPAPARDLDESLYPLLFAITPNEVEAEKLSGVAYESDSDVRKMAEVFRSKGVENTIITLGKKGAYLLDEKGDEYHYANYDDITVLDSTGAGDAFNGGLLAALGEGKTVKEAVSFANVVSNLSVTRMGTSTSMPSRDEIMGFISSHVRKITKSFCFEPPVVQKG